MKEWNPIEPARKKKRRRKLTIGLALTAAVIGGVLYGLADRYLIEHVEAVVSPPAATVGTAVESGTAGTGETAAAKVQYDDWNYKSEDIEIGIKQEQTGSGADTVTYFVADVVLKGPAGLKTAFAKNAFGRNIIENTSKIASDNNAIFAINGDYYGFRNDGVIIRNGVLYRDDPARAGLALYKNGTLQTYDEKAKSSSDLLADGVLNTFSFGPVLMQNGKVTGSFENVKVDTNFGNRTIQSANPRTGVGMIAPNHYVFVVVDGRKENYSRGMTLNEFAGLFAKLGATEAYNLDGGGSSTMYFMGRVVNNPLGKQTERGVSDILYIAE